MAAAVEHVEEGVQDVARAAEPRPTPWVRTRQVRFQKRPLGVRQIARVRFVRHGNERRTSSLYFFRRSQKPNSRKFGNHGHPGTRTGHVCLLNAAGVRVVGEFGTGEEAFWLVGAVRPDLVVLTLNLTGDMDGIETLLRMKALPDPPRVLVHTAYNSADDLTSCFLAGADGFVHKSSGREEFLEAVRSAASGELVWFPGERAGDPRSLVDTTPAGASLTPREREVLASMLRRHSNAEIAEALHISAQTAKNHASKVLRKLGMQSRKELFSRNQVPVA